jgi:hypothetical protein
MIPSFVRKKMEKLDSGQRADKEEKRKKVLAYNK